MKINDDWEINFDSRCYTLVQRFEQQSDRNGNPPKEKYGYRNRYYPTLKDAMLAAIEYMIVEGKKNNDIPSLLAYMKDVTKIVVYAVTGKKV